MEFISIVIIISLVVSIFIGLMLGYAHAKIQIRKKEKELLENFNEILDGKRENFVEFEGVKYTAEKFLIRDDKGNETIIDLKGGRIEPKQYDHKKESQKERKPVSRKKLGRDRSKSKKVSRTGSRKKPDTKRRRRRGGGRRGRFG